MSQNHLLLPQLSALTEQLPIWVLPGCVCRYKILYWKDRWMVSEFTLQLFPPVSCDFTVIFSHNKHKLQQEYVPTAEVLLFPTVPEYMLRLSWCRKLPSQTKLQLLYPLCYSTMPRTQGQYNYKRDQLTQFPTVFMLCLLHISSGNSDYAQVWKLSSNLGEPSIIISIRDIWPKLTVKYCAIMVKFHFRGNSLSDGFLSCSKSVEQNKMLEIKSFPKFTSI